jgi:putative hemolysin
MKSLYLPLCLILTLAGEAACSSLPSTEKGAAAPSPQAGQAQLANPASVHCVSDLGGTLDIRTDKDGGQYGVCKLPNGSVCEEWALFRDKQCVAPKD